MLAMSCSHTKAFHRPSSKRQGSLSIKGPYPVRAPRLRRCPPPLRMSLFEPRLYPPQALQGVPEAYVHIQLRSLAQSYWANPETSDCTIIVPYFAPQSTPSALFPGNVSALNNQVAKPSLPTSANRLVMKLHVDFLSAHSLLLRGLFAGTSAQGMMTAMKTRSTHFPSPSPGGMPHILASSSPQHPKIYLPVPDPTSLGLLVHWCYFGTTHFLEDRLNRGLVSWDGVMRNIEYLGLSDEIRVFMGEYIRRSYADTPSTPDLEADTGSDTDDTEESLPTADEEDWSMSDDGHCAATEQPVRGRSIVPRTLANF